MAFVELKPVLQEPLPQVPDTWRGRLPDGTAVAVRRYPGSSSPAAVARLRAIAGVRHPGLLVPLGAAPDGDGLVVSYPADLRRGLDTALGGPLDPAAALALADDLLATLTALHAAGQAHGAIEESAVRLSYPEGEARLWAPRPEPPAGPAAKSDDVRALAQLICRTMALPLEWTPSDPLRDVERAAPALAATLRALARGGLVLDAAGAVEALREAAGGLEDQESRDAGRAALRDLAGGGAPVLPPVEMVAPAPEAVHPHRPSTADFAPLERASRPLLLPAAIVGGLLFLVLVGAISFRLAARPSPPAASEPPASRAGTSPSPSAVPSPSEPPASSGDVRSVAEAAQGECAVGASCVVEVTVYFAKATGPEEVTWQFQVIDECTSEATYVDGNKIQAQSGWTHVIGDTPVHLPAGHPLSLVAVTITPSQAASPPLLLAGGSC